MTTFKTISEVFILSSGLWHQGVR